jgi:hypothetical protein
MLADGGTEAPLDWAAGKLVGANKNRIKQKLTNFQNLKKITRKTVTCIIDTQGSGL